jgi:hypothetical protein
MSPNNNTNNFSPQSISTSRFKAWDGKEDPGKSG